MGLSSNIKNREFQRLRKSKLFTEVISGKYPMEKICKMNSSKLRQLVLRLLAFTAEKAGNSRKSKPLWWPSNMTFHCILDLNGISTKKGVKKFRSYLQSLILSCCNFFRNCQHDIQFYHETWINDENSKPNGEKRSISSVPELSSKRRRTLVSRNEPEDNDKTVVVFKTKPRVAQSDFLTSVQLEETDSASSVRSKLPAGLRTLKIHNCPHIPLSSDVGRLIMHQENYSVPEYIIDRKLERLEWYVNKDIRRLKDHKFEISYVSPKTKHTHIYKFPIRQYHQIHGNVKYKDMLLKKCRPLRVQVIKEDLLAKKWNLMNICITVPKLSSNIVSEYLSKTKMCNESSHPNSNS